MAGVYFSAILHDSHCCTFDCLQFSSAFIGFRTFHFYIMGALLACNTWAGLLVSTRYLGQSTLYLSDGQNEEDLVRNFDVALDQASMFYTVFRLAVLVLTVTFVTVERNHLMAFAVFTPKFIFESIGQSIEGCNSLIWHCRLHCIFENVEHSEFHTTRTSAENMKYSSRRVSYFPFL